MAERKIQSKRRLITITYEINTNKLLSDKQLDQVAGGTFDANMYSKKEYNAAGVETDYHFFAKDDFYVMSRCDLNGKDTGALRRYHITYDAANAAVQFYKRTGKEPTIYDIAKAVGKDNVLRK